MHKEWPEGRIRSASEADAAQIAEVYRPFVEDTAISFELEAPSVREMRVRIARALERHQWLVFESGESVLGYAYSAPFHERPAYRWSVELSVYVRRDVQSHGVGRRLLGALIRDGKDRGFVNAFAGIALPNDRSVKLFESLGFVQIAVQEQVGYKLGAWHDVGWWQLKLQNAPEDPSVPEASR